MNYQFKISLASENNNMTKDHNNHSLSNDDTDYDYEKVQEILDTKDVKRKSAKQIISFIKTYAPDKKEIEEYVTDIIDYYKKYFEITESVEEKNINLRIFPYDQNKNAAGDAGAGEIRISFSQCVDQILNNIEWGSHLEEKLDFESSVNVQPKECFTICFLTILSHELFHIFHESDYFKVKNLNYRDPFATLCEVFADYFSYSYMDYYIAKTSTKDTLNHKRALVFSNQVIQREYKLFGIGRKKWAQGTDLHYLVEDIEEDNNNAEKLINEGKIAKCGWESGRSRVDYSGGYVLYKLANKTNNGVQGREFLLFKQMYELTLKCTPDEALYIMLSDMDKNKNVLY